MKKFYFTITLCLLLIINYMFNIFNPNNEVFADFQSVSDSLVLEMIIAGQNHVNTEKWGLGYYADLAGRVSDW